MKDRLAVGRWATHKFDMVRFNLKKLKEAEGKEQYKVKITNRFAVL
jgi:hypothetical protein